MHIILTMLFHLLNTTELLKNSLDRNRLKYSLIAILSISLGLFSRSQYMIDVPFLKEYSGDAIWGLMVFFIFATILKQSGSIVIALSAISFCFAIEFSQLYHAPWIDTIRDYRLGGLIFGFGFKSTDLICYVAGVAIGYMIDLVLLRFRLQLDR
jgi:hypothetical protein